LQVGGIEDHVHLFFGLSRTRTIADVVETVKTSSSKWIKTKDADVMRNSGLMLATILDDRN
jgi:putative transposase